MEKTYTEDQVKLIKEDMKKKTETKFLLDFAKKINSTVANNLVDSQKKKKFSNKFTQDNVIEYLEDPVKYEKELRNLSTVLTTISPQYQQIISYMPSISKFVPIVVPNLDKFTSSNGGTVDIEQFKKEYMEVTAHVEKLNIPHEFQRITGINSRDDVFYGYIHETDDSFYIQQLDSDYCKISMVSDGVFNYQFDFAYFDRNTSIKGIEGNLIDSYPKEFKKKYNLYLKDKSRYKWQELDEDKTICIKMLEELTFPFPPFSSLFNDLADLSTYKDLTKTKTKVDNYKFIGMEIPRNEKDGKVDSFSVDPNTALQFYEMLLSNLPEGIGAFLSVTPFKDINFGSGTITDKDNVNRAEDNVFTSSGISPINFGKGASTSTGLKASNLVDSARLFKLYRQFERWLNRKFKKEYNGKFTIKLLDVTVFNLNETIDEMLKLSQYGLPVKLQLSALCGVTQGLERGLTFLEDRVLNLSTEWKPLASSHTTSGSDNNGGAEEVSDDNLSDEGEKSRDADGNIDRDI